MPTSVSAQELRMPSAPDIGRLPGEVVIKPISVGELPTRAGVVESVPEVSLPSAATQVVRPVEYLTLDEFRLPEDEPPLTPLAVQVGADESVNVLDAGQPDAFRWVRFSPENQVVHSVSIPRESAGLQAPTGIALDAQGRLYVADLVANCVWRYDVSGAATAIGQGESLSGLLDVALDKAGNLLVAESSACRVTKLDPAGGRLLSFGTPDRPARDEEEEEEIEDETPAGPPAPDRLANPGAVATDAQGNIYIADTNHHRVLKLDAGGAFVGYVAQGVELLFPSGVKVSTAGDLFVADLDGSRIHKFDPNGKHLFSLPFESKSVGGEFDIDGEGNLYLPSKSNQAILKVRHAG
jgi:streptogramin lyase